MKILFCRTGWMNSYSGIKNDSLSGGGAYNKDNIGHEIYNFYNNNGKYHGYVQPVAATINIERISKETLNDDCVDDVLVVWVAKNPVLGGQFVVGWYRNATVYKHFQKLTKKEMGKRDSEFYWYNIITETATLLNPSQRNKIIDGMGQSNVWYGKEEVNDEIIRYVENIESKRQENIENIESVNKLSGYERDVIAKARINQGYFRKIMLKKYNSKCCLCGVAHEELLIASHIKPWSDSDENEKLNEFNGLLLCPNHDKLFDKGYISFDNDGKILISDEIDEYNRMFLNINDDMSITVDEDNISFIEFHRKNIFKD